MSEHNYFLTLGLIIGTILLVFGMKYFVAARQARAKVAGDGAYRVLAEKAAAAETQIAAALAALKTETSEIGARLIAVEKILKEVE
jgi:hypothetical protein